MASAHAEPGGKDRTGLSPAYKADFRGDAGCGAGRIFTLPPNQLGGDTSLGSCRRKEADVCVLRFVWDPPRHLGSYPAELVQ